MKKGSYNDWNLGVNFKRFNHPADSSFKLIRICVVLKPRGCCYVVGVVPNNVSQLHSTRTAHILISGRASIPFRNCRPLQKLKLVHSRINYQEIGRTVAPEFKLLKMVASGHH